MVLAEVTLAGIEEVAGGPITVVVMGLAEVKLAGI